MHVAKLVQHEPSTSRTLLSIGEISGRKQVSQKFTVARQATSGSTRHPGEIAEKLLQSVPTLAPPRRRRSNSRRRLRVATLASLVLARKRGNQQPLIQSNCDAATAPAARTMTPSTLSNRPSGRPTANSSPLLSQLASIHRSRSRVRTNRRSAARTFACVVLVAAATYAIVTSGVAVTDAEAIARSVEVRSTYLGHVVRTAHHLHSSTRMVFRTWLRWYLRQLHFSPLGARALTAGFIFFLADAIAQALALRQLAASGAQSKLLRFSTARLVRYTAYGFFVMGPFLYLWYSLMEEYGPEDDLSGALQKSIFEQIVLEPVCISGYILYEGVVCRRNMNVTYRKLRTSIWPLWFKNAIFWMPANFSNYYIGTPDLRVLFANLCSLFWNIYFSSKVNSTARPNASAGRPSVTPTPSAASKLELPLHREKRTTSTTLLPAATTARLRPAHPASHPTTATTESSDGSISTDSSHVSTGSVSANERGVAQNIQITNHERTPLASHSMLQDTSQEAVIGMV